MSKIMERFINTIRNQYLIATVAFLIWMCFFDRYDIATQYHFQAEKTKLEKEKNIILRKSTISNSQSKMCSLILLKFSVLHVRSIR